MGIIYHVKTAKSPTKGTFIEGLGSWIVNRHSGYYLGRVEVYDLFEVVYETKSKKVWYYGRSYGVLRIRGFIMPGSLGGKYKTIADTCSPESRHNLERNRLKFGHDFNAPSSVSQVQVGGPIKQTGTPVKVNTDCNLDYNYFIGESFRGGRFRSKHRPPPMTAGTQVLYRYTTWDDKAVVIHHPVHGWGFAPASCIDRPSKVFNDNG
jgi:hypothetical protein